MGKRWQSVLSPLTNPTWKGLVAGITLTSLSFLTARRLYRLIDSRKHASDFIDRRPCLMYSGAASLWCYYTGVYYYLYHKFDLTNVRTSGISMGVTVSFATVMHMNPRQKFEIGLHWAAMIWNRPLKCFLMHSDDWVDTGMRITKEFGFTDEDVKKHIGTNTVFAGVTDVSVFPPQHVILKDAKTLRESLYWTTLSMRIFPFYRYLGWYRNMIIADGVFSGFFTTPPNLDESQAIRISPFALPGTDVHPLFPQEMFSARDICYSKTAKQMFRQLKIGYQAAERAHEKLLRKGLKPKAEAGRDEFGQIGTLDHLIVSSEYIFEEFKKKDPLKTWD
ncbi:hypothetical protein TrST_g11221 [Triparma strigata]|uniref:Uncharacterized protein n=1 Tax=Triparma strigata TaxID=1606541 RepID=A0A9W7BC49_9STRA|nr:hypothetical protein TrST_g11221 [Triparma strigata]